MLFVVLDDGNNGSENIQVSLNCCLFVVGVVIFCSLVIDAERRQNPQETLPKNESV